MAFSYAEPLGWPIILPAGAPVELKLPRWYGYRGL